MKFAKKDPQPFLAAELIIPKGDINDNVFFLEGLQNSFSVKPTNLKANISFRAYQGKLFWKTIPDKFKVIVLNFSEVNNLNLLVRSLRVCPKDKKVIWIFKKKKLFRLAAALCTFPHRSDMIPAEFWLRYTHKGF